MKKRKAERETNIERETNQETAGRKDGDSSTWPSLMESVGAPCGGCGLVQQG
jgi:hypothetical protein